MPFAEFSPAEVGTSTGGFRLASAAQGLLRITVWGYWQADVVRSFAIDAPGALQRLASPGTLVLDASELKPQGPDGQEALRALFRAVLAHQPMKAMVISINVLTGMQLARLLRETGVDGCVEMGDNSTVTPGA